MSICDWIGIPYELGGSSELGADCWGLSVFVFLRERGIQLPPYNLILSGKKVPPRGYVAEQVRAEGTRAWRQVEQSGAAPFDLVVLRNLRPADHIGVVSEHPELILTTDRGANAHLAEWGPKSRWAGKIEGVFRHVGA